jgi:hypothetical protein
VVLKRNRSILGEQIVHMSMAASDSATSESADPKPMAAQRRFTFDVGIGPRLMVAAEVLQEIPLGATLQALPNAPTSLAGAVNLRGAIRIVFDPLAALRIVDKPPQRRILLLDRETHCTGVLIVGEPRLDELRPAHGVVPSGPWAASTRTVWMLNSGESVLEIDHRGWFMRLRDLSRGDLPKAVPVHPA